MSYRYNYLFLVSDYMAEYTMRELDSLDCAEKLNKSHLSENKLVDFIFRAYLSVGANRLFSLPFKKFIYNCIFKTAFKENKPLCIVIAPPWYDKQLIKYLKKKYPDCKLIIHFHDTVSNSLKRNRRLSLDIVKNDFDKAIVYNPDDAKNHGFLLHSVGYTPLPQKELKAFPHSDVVFIGAAKDRLPLIRRLYRRFSEAGLKCDFYVTEVPKNERLNDGIIYGDKPLPFTEYLAREAASDCLLEILQKGSTGRTYRMIEAIIYNKKLITNCPEIKETPYYNEDFVCFFNDESEISAEFVKRDDCQVDYHYCGDFSHRTFIEFIEDYFS